VASFWLRLLGVCRGAALMSQHPTSFSIAMFRFIMATHQVLDWCVWCRPSQYHYTCHSKARQSFLRLIWLLCVWLLWNERNNRLFNNIETPILQLLDKVKFHSFWWLKANNATFVYGSQRWW